MKKWDFIIIGLLLLISFVPYVIFGVVVGNGLNGTYAEIMVEGKLYKEIPLTGQVAKMEWLIETDRGMNLVVVEEEQIAVTHANCSDGLCEQFGWIKNPGEVIVCLPHQVYIEVKARKANDAVDDGVDARLY